MEFEHLVRPQGVITSLQHRLPNLSQGDFAIDQCRILHLNYKRYLKPASRDKSCLSAAYQLEIERRTTGERNSQIIYAKAFLGNRSYGALEKALRRPLRPTKLGIPLVHLNDLGMVIWTFPNDPEMTWLGELTDAEAVRKHLPIEADADLEIEIVNYRPEVRCTLRYEFDGRALYGKTFCDDRGAEIYRRMEWLWTLQRQAPGAFPMAQPLGYDKSLRTIWQEEWTGEPLAAALTFENYAAIAAQIAARLAFLHQAAVPASLPTESRLDPEAQLDEVKKKIDKLCMAFPPLASQLQRLGTELLLKQRLLPEARPCLLHGDFHLRQMRIRRDEIALFDFDELAVGDPAEDLANFIADMYAHTSGYAVEEYPLLPSLAPNVASALLDSYMQCTTAAVAPDRLQWHLAVQSLTRAYRAWLQQPPRLEEQVQYLIDFAYQTLMSSTLNVSRI